MSNASQASPGWGGFLSRCWLWLRRLWVRPTPLLLKAPEGGVPNELRRRALRLHGASRDVVQGAFDDVAAIYELFVHRVDGEAVDGLDIVGNSEAALAKLCERAENAQGQVQRARKDSAGQAVKEQAGESLLRLREEGALFRELANACLAWSTDQSAERRHLVDRYARQLSSWLRES